MYSVMRRATLLNSSLHKNRRQGKFPFKFLNVKIKSSSLKMKPSIPNLEMSAAYEAAKLAHLLRTEYNIPSNKNLLYTDSTCVYHWCRKQ